MAIVKLSAGTIEYDDTGGDKPVETIELQDVTLLGNDSGALLFTAASSRYARARVPVY